MMPMMMMLMVMMLMMVMVMQSEGDAASSEVADECRPTLSMHMADILVAANDMPSILLSSA